jgi:hypothetical protein
MRFSTTATAFANYALVAPSFASPLSNDETNLLSARDVFVGVASNCQDIVYGAKSIVSSKICIGIAEGTMTVTADVVDGWTLDEVHILVGLAKPTLATPGQFPYGTHKGSCVKNGLTATCSIPIQSAWRGCDKTLYVAVHVAATTPEGVEQTGWGRGVCYDTKGNCAKYWTFTTSCA